MNLFLIKDGHVFPMEQILCALTNLSLRGVINNGLNQRLEYFSGQRDFWRAQFDRLAVVLPPISPSEVVVHIRAADILKPSHSSYYPLPLDFYDVIFEELGMTPVFIGQLSDDHPYLESLQLRYPGRAVRFKARQWAISSCFAGATQRSCRFHRFRGWQDGWAAMIVGSSCLSVAYSIPSCDRISISCRRMTSAFSFAGSVR